MEASAPVQACNGIALPLPLLVTCTQMINIVRQKSQNRHFDIPLYEKRFPRKVASINLMNNL
jgi:hypothetical protein